jgi:hypothetical protein
MTSRIAINFLEFWRHPHAKLFAHTYACVLRFIINSHSSYLQVEITFDCCYIREEYKELAFLHICEVIIENLGLLFKCVRFIALY